MIKAKETEYVIFDVETTGLSPLRGDRIVEIAAVKVKNFVVVDTLETFINPERDIPIEAQQINKITPEMIAHAPKAEEVLPKMIDFIGGACVVGHNVKFDLDFLCYQLSLFGRKLNEGTPVVDTLKMSKELLPHLRSFQLANIAFALGVPIKNTHRALADVQLTTTVFQRLLNIAHDQKLDQFVDVHKRFGIEKPNFRIFQLNQGSLF